MSPTPAAVEAAGEIVARLGYPTDDVPEIVEEIDKAFARGAGRWEAVVSLCEAHKGCEIVPGPYCPYCTANQIMRDRDAYHARLRAAAPAPGAEGETRIDWSKVSDGDSVIVGGRKITMRVEPFRADPHPEKHPGIPADLDTLLHKWADARATFRRDYDPQDEERAAEAWNALLRGLNAWATPARGGVDAAHWMERMAMGVVMDQSDVTDTPAHRGPIVEAIRSAYETGVKAATPPRAPAEGAAGPSSITLIVAERRRQVEAEGWTAAHDDEHAAGELAVAAACYAIPASRRDCGSHIDYPALWPWDPSWWKPGDRVRELVKAGALVAAEIDRLQRAAARGGGE